MTPCILYPTGTMPACLHDVSRSLYLQSHTLRQESPTHMPEIGSHLGPRYIPLPKYGLTPIFHENAVQFINGTPEDCIQNQRGTLKYHPQHATIELVLNPVNPPFLDNAARYAKPEAQNGGQVCGLGCTKGSTVDRYCNTIPQHSTDISAAGPYFMFTVAVNCKIAELYK